MVYRKIPGLYSFVKLLCQLLFGIFFRNWGSFHTETIPEEGTEPLLVISNHSNFLMDGLALLATFPGQISFLMAQPNFKTAIGGIARKIGAIPVMRPQDAERYEGINPVTISADGLSVSGLDIGSQLTPGDTIYIECGSNFKDTNKDDRVTQCFGIVASVSFDNRTVTIKPPGLKWIPVTLTGERDINYVKLRKIVRHGSLKIRVERGNTWVGIHNALHPGEADNAPQTAAEHVVQLASSATGTVGKFVAKILSKSPPPPQGPRGPQGVGITGSSANLHEYSSSPQVSLSLVRQSQIVSPSASQHRDSHEIEEVVVETSPLLNRSHHTIRGPQLYRSTSQSNSASSFAMDINGSGRRLSNGVGPLDRVDQQQQPSRSSTFSSTTNSATSGSITPTAGYSSNSLFGRSQQGRYSALPNAPGEEEGDIILENGRVFIETLPLSEPTLVIMADEDGNDDDDDEESEQVAQRSGVDRLDSSDSTSSVVTTTSRAGPKPGTIITTKTTTTTTKRNNGNGNGSSNGNGNNNNNNGSTTATPPATTTVSKAHFPTSPCTFQYSKPIDHSMIYESVWKNFANNRTVAVFPEGVSSDDYHLLDFKYGCTVMVLGYLSQHPGKSLRILPCGLNFFNRHRFRSRFYADYGKPIQVPQRLVDMYGEGGEAKKQACTELLTMIHTSVHDLTLNAPDYDELRLYKATRRLYATGMKLSVPQKLELTRRFARAYTTLPQTIAAYSTTSTTTINTNNNSMSASINALRSSPDAIAALKRDINAYDKHLSHSGVLDSQLVQDPNFFICLFFFLPTLFSLPFLFLVSLPGTLLFGPVGLISTWSAKKKGNQAMLSFQTYLPVTRWPGRDVIATWKIVTALILTPLAFILYTTILTMLVHHYWKIRGGELVLFWLVVCFVVFPVITFGTVMVWELQIRLKSKVQVFGWKLWGGNKGLKSWRMDLETRVRDLVGVMGGDQIFDVVAYQ